MARRAGTALAVLMILLGLLFDFWPTVIILALVVLAAAVFGCWRAVRWWQHRKHTRTWMYPAHLNAAPLAGVPVTADPASWLAIEQDRSRVVAELPPAYNPDDKQRARLSYRRAAELFEEATAGEQGGPWTLHQLRHSAPTHDAENGASTPMLMAKSGHTSVASLARYARPSAEALQRWQEQNDPARRR